MKMKGCGLALLLQVCAFRAVIGVSRLRAVPTKGLPLPQSAEDDKEPAFRLNCSETTTARVGRQRVGESESEQSGGSSFNQSKALSQRSPEDCIEGGTTLLQFAARGRGQLRECQQCYTSCASEGEAFGQCLDAYYLTCDAGKKALSFCRCEQGGWDYPYMNPAGRPAGQFSWKCCFFHKCMKE